MQSRVGQALETMSPGGPLQFPSICPDGLVIAAGVNDIPMKKETIPDHTGKLMPVQIFVLPGKVPKRSDVGRHRIVVSKDDVYLTILIRIQKRLNELLSGEDRATEDSVLGPLEVKNIPVQDKHFSLRNQILNP